MYFSTLLNVFPLLLVWSAAASDDSAPTYQLHQKWVIPDFHQLRRDLKSEGTQENHCLESSPVGSELDPDAVRFTMRFCPRQDNIYMGMYLFMEQQENHEWSQLKRGVHKLRVWFDTPKGKQVDRYRGTIGLASGVSNGWLAFWDEIPDSWLNTNGALTIKWEMDVSLV